MTMLYVIYLILISQVIIQARPAWLGYWEAFWFEVIVDFICLVIWMKKVNPLIQRNWGGEKSHE